MTQEVRVCENGEHLELPDDVAVAGPVVVADTEGGQVGQGGQFPHRVDGQQVAVQGQCLQVMFNQVLQFKERILIRLSRQIENFDCISLSRRLYRSFVLFVLIL